MTQRPAPALLRHLASGVICLAAGLVPVARQAQTMPAPVASDPSVAEPDSFIPGDGGYALYLNARYGTFISYPATYFQPAPAPTSGDGRSFTSVDGQVGFMVFAQYEALGLSPAQQMVEDIATHGGASYKASGRGWYVISGLSGTDIYYRRVIQDDHGLIRVFEITYPQSRKAEFDAVVAYMAASFGPGSD